jgi:hypothetical protein
VATAVADLPLPARAAELPTAPADADALDDLARRWGVERQVREVQAAIARQTDPGQTDDE